MKRFLFSILLVFIVLWSGCARNMSYFDKVQSQARQRQFEFAADLIKQNSDKYPERDRVLYHLDRGMLFLYAGNADQAIEYLSEAEKEMADLFTKSVSKQAASLVTNDYVLPYAGLDYEQLLINAFLALAYASQGKTDDALVEIRKVQTKCNILKEKNASNKAIKDDGFLRYLAGILYEQDKDYDNAYISYYTAWKAYQLEAQCPIPPTLKSVLLTLAKKTGRTDDIEEFKKSFGTLPEESPLVGSTEIVAVSLIGDGPVIISKEFATTAVDVEGKTWHLKFAIPEFKRTSSFVNSVELFLPGAMGVPSDLVEESRNLCQNDLEARMGGIIAKTTARVLVKTIAAHKAKQKLYQSSGNNPLSNFVLGMATDVTMDQLEHADTRVCRLFPGEVRIARVPVKPGQYDITLGLRTRSGSETTPARKVDVKAGDKRIIVYSDLR